jgi:hypothetical protein
MNKFAALILSAAMATAVAGTASAQVPSAPVPASLAVGGGLTAGAVAGIVIIVGGIAVIVSDDGTVSTTTAN